MTTKYTELTPDGKIYSGILTPPDFGLPVSSPESLLGGEPSENAQIIHSIFDGEKGDYLETDIPNALNMYALSKIDAEKKVLELDRSIVIRSEPMYGFDNGKNK